jgi:choline-sulfatase
MSNCKVDVSRRTALKILGATSGGMAMGANGSALSRDNIPLKDCNVLMVMADELSASAVRCYQNLANAGGDALIDTPALDALAASGTLFSSAYCQNPICVPSRMALITGRMPSNLSVYGDADVMSPDVPTFADAFKASGYTVGAVGKLHIVNGKPEGLNQQEMKFLRPYGDNSKKSVPGIIAWNDWQRDKLFNYPPRGTYSENDLLQSSRPQDAAVANWPAECGRDEGVAEFSTQFIDAHHNEKFFFISSFGGPHFPFTIQKEYLDLYNNDAMNAPVVTQAMLDDLPPPELENYLDKQDQLFSMTAGQTKYARAMYYGMVRRIDELIARVVGKLDDYPGLRQKTIVIFASDHGEMKGEHGLWYKNTFFEGGVRVPLIISLPEAAGPQVPTTSAPAMLIDLFPTLCELTGVIPPVGLEGQSLVALLKGGKQGASHVALSENFVGNYPARMIRRGEWKYTLYREKYVPGQAARHADTVVKEQLFNLKRDPLEGDNVVAYAKNAKLVAELRARALAGWNYSTWHPNFGVGYP